eukprot:1072115-Pleurochrysis_carterae.AAC.1
MMRDDAGESMVHKATVVVMAMATRASRRLQWLDVRKADKLALDLWVEQRLWRNRCVDGSGVSVRRRRARAEAVRTGCAERWQRLARAAAPASVMAAGVKHIEAEVSSRSGGALMAPRLTLLTVENAPGGMHREDTVTFALGAAVGKWIAAQPTRCVVRRSW